MKAYYMPQLANAALSDGTVTHTFTPRGIDNTGVATLVESTGVPIGDLRLTAGRNRTSAGREKATFKLAIPVVQDVVVAGVSRPTAVRSTYVDVAFSFDGTSSTAERNVALQLTKALLANADVLLVVRDLQTYY